MSRLEGMLDPDELSRAAGSGDIETVLVVFPDLYGRLMGKRYSARYFAEACAESGTHACDYLLTVDMEMEPVPGYEFANWNLGYGDIHLVPDLSTLRRAAWLEKTALVICDVVDEETHRPVSIAPRSMLGAQVGRLARSGYEAQAASELEYYIFEDSYRAAAERGYAGLTPSGWYLEDYHVLHGTRHERLNAPVRRFLDRSGVPVENSKGEWGLGQHELNIRHADVLDMADRHTIYKQCVKEVADGLGLSVTFMAKFDASRAGSSCHVHLSLWKDGRNVFAGGEDDDPLAGSVRASKAFRHFLAGWIAHVPEVMVFYAPTVNSYKRYRSGSWAPTRLAWSLDNRTAGFRVVGSGASLRIECRIPGADCNPYLVYAAAIASGLDGLERQLEPPPVFAGDAYAHGVDAPRVPASLREATDAFEASEFARRAFGVDVVEHYTHFFRTEQAAFDDAVTDWERRRYFERI